MKAKGEIVLLDRGRVISRRFSGVTLETGGGVKHYPDFAGRIVVSRLKEDSLWIARGNVYGKSSLGERLRLQLVGALAGAVILRGAMLVL